MACPGGRYRQTHIHRIEEVADEEEMYQFIFNQKEYKVQIVLFFPLFEFDFCNSFLFVPMVLFPLYLLVRSKKKTEEQIPFMYPWWLCWWQIEEDEDGDEVFTHTKNTLNMG